MLIIASKTTSTEWRQRGPKDSAQRRGRGVTVVLVLFAISTTFILSLSFMSA